MSGIKVLNCTANNVYALASKPGGQTVKLNEFIRMYTHNVNIGKVVNNTWTLRNPGLEPGLYSVTMVADWSCRHWIFTETSTRIHDSIYLLVE